MSPVDMPKSLQWTQSTLVALFKHHEPNSAACGCGDAASNWWEHMARLVLDGPLLCVKCSTAMEQWSRKDFLCYSCGMSAVTS